VTYYRVLRDSAVTDLCFLGAPLDSSGTIDARRFTDCEKFGAPGESLKIPVVEHGRRPEFAFGAFDMPVVAPQLGNRLRDLAPEAVELIPAIAGGTECHILNVFDCVDCIDEDRTVGEKWPADSPRADRIGQYRTIVHLFLDPRRVSGRHIFRVQGWQVALVISDRVVEQLSRRDLDGIRLLPVTPEVGVR
jgi:hypothetical protein